MSRPPRDRGDWVTLLDGVRVSRRWMTLHTPQLLAAWSDAQSPERRCAMAARILQVAAELESEPGGGDVDEVLNEWAWRPVAERVDARLVRGPDWPPLAAALTRAHAAGYDIATRLRTLAAAAPLPDRHPARELHWRLLDDCPAALPWPMFHKAGDAAVDSQPGHPQRSSDRPPGERWRCSLRPHGTDTERTEDDRRSRQ